MQFGATPADLAKSLGRIPGWINGKEGETAASPIGAIAVAIHEAANAPRDAIGGAEMGYVDVSAVQVAEKQGGAVGRDFDGAAE